MNNNMFHAILSVMPDENFLLQIRMCKLGILSSVCLSEPLVIHHLPFSDFLIVDMEMFSPDFISNIRCVSKNILIVAVSNEYQEYAREHALKIGADYFLLKPYSLSDLKSILSPKQINASSHENL